MNTSSSSNGKSRGARRASLVLALMSVIALALSASPTALAKDRGRPSAPSVQQPNLDEFFHVLRQLRSVSWSD